MLLHDKEDSCEQILSQEIYLEGLTVAVCDIVRETDGRIRSESGEDRLSNLRKEGIICVTLLTCPKYKYPMTRSLSTSAIYHVLWFVDQGLKSPSSRLILQNTELDNYFA